MADEPSSTRLSVKDKVTYTMAAGLMFCVMLYAFMVTWIPIPATGLDFAKYILAFLLGSVLGTIIGVYYGTSKSSQERSDMQNKKDAVTPEPAPTPSQPVNQSTSQPPVNQPVNQSTSQPVISNQSSVSSKQSAGASPIPGLTGKDVQ